jgi:3-methylcrotonyl-CoA carboxylase alpha subunit
MLSRRRLLRITSTCARFLSTNGSLSAIEKILIANRGEIACRISRTCQRLGIPTVAIYSDADGPEALHTQMATESHKIGYGPAASQSYLMGDEIIRIAHLTGSKAIHPGYGFLSENAGFAQAVEDSGLIFIGPSPSSISSMGSKSKSKELMKIAGVPITPGFYGNNQDPDFLFYQAIHIVGFPLLIKAVMGGGGKGMRLVWNEQDFLESLKSCQQESLASFGDSSVLLEKYLVHPRHIEVQIMADHQGNIIHLHERDCSLQRRHQKIIEEAPAPNLEEQMRQKLGEMGVRAAQAVNYRNAGTVEFLLDTQSVNNKFYFCEMNTRLQVEHPITEMITGLDLVEWQLRIASGEDLPIKNQNEIPKTGHSFEARIYAENPLKGFLPATGTVRHHEPPTDVRIDTGIKTGQDVTVYYDPMISKLIVHGSDRATSLSTLISSLEHYRIAGLPTNIDFLVRCAKHPVFQKPGACNTGFLDNYMNDIIGESYQVPCAMSFAAAAVCSLLHEEKRIGIHDLQTSRLSAGNPWSSLSGSWRSGSVAKRTFKDVEYDVRIECSSRTDGSFDVSVMYPTSGVDEKMLVKATLELDWSLSLIVDESKRVNYFTYFNVHGDDKEIHLWSKTQSIPHHSVKIRFEGRYASDVKQSVRSIKTEGNVSAPMPGKIVRIEALLGANVKKGDVLIIMEAMKMQHILHSPCDGILTKLYCNEDTIVEDNALLAIISTS